MCDGQSSNETHEKTVCWVLLGLLGNIEKDEKLWPAFIEWLPYPGHITECFI